MLIAFFKSYRGRFFALPLPLAELGSPKILVLTVGPQTNFSIVMAKVGNL